MSASVPHPRRAVFDLDDLPHTRQSYEFVGAEHGAVPFSVILVHSSPGKGPELHRHPYAEVFFVESGTARFRLGNESIEVHGGQVVVGPPDVPHGFVNSGDGELRVTAIHGAPRFSTEWLAEPDDVWVSKPEPGRGAEAGGD